MLKDEERHRAWDLGLRGIEIWGFAKIGGTFFGVVPRIRIVIFGGLYWGFIVLGPPVCGRVRLFHRHQFWSWN